MLDIDKLIHGIKTSVYRSLVFSVDDRNFYFRLIRAYHKSNYSMPRIIDALKLAGNSRPLRELARKSRQNIANQYPFARRLSKTGYITASEEALLNLGEKHGSLDKTISVILSTDTYTLVPVKLLAPSAQWLLTTVLMIGIAVTIGETMRKFAGSMTWYFDVCAAIVAFSPLIVAVFAGLSFLYISVRGSASAIRATLHRLGLFNLHTKITEHKLLCVLKELTETQIPPNDLYTTVLALFPKHRWLVKKIKYARERLTEETYNDTLQYILSKHTYLNIIAAAPDKLPKQIATGMNLAIEMLELQINRTIARQRLLLSILSLALAGAALFPFLLISFGLGIDQTQMGL